MNIGLKKPAVGGEANSLSREVELEKVNEVRRLIGPQADDLAHYCSDASIARYLRARNGNIKKAVKMLNASLKWRTAYKPERIRWDDISQEAETGKIYRSNYRDKLGRPVLVMRPRCQNSKSIKGQIKYLVYCMENAISNLPGDQEQMVWLIDFHGFSLSNISVKVTRETAYVLQEQYPERLGVAILYDAPKIFEPFWAIAKPFLEPKTANKVKFVYSNDPNTSKIMDEIFDMELVESSFGGKSSSDFDINKYAERMREDDKKFFSFPRLDNDLVAINSMLDSGLNGTNSDSDSDTGDVKMDEPQSSDESVLAKEELNMNNGKESQYLNLTRVSSSLS